MGVAWDAREEPDRPAILSARGNRTFRELNAQTNRLVRALRARGLRPGDGVALLCSNRPEFAEVLYATVRAGFRITPINWHLTGEEVGYIVRDCDARAFVADERYAQEAVEGLSEAEDVEVPLAVGGPIPGFESYDEVVAKESAEDVSDPILGSSMLYTSGTTGRPKGVYRRVTPPSALLELLDRAGRYRPGEDLALCTGPLYHAAPLALNLRVPIAGGIGVYLMDRWDAEETLRLIEQHRITHTHMVPTMFHRLLSLPEETRRRYDLSSLRFVLHGAAPCPVEIKQSMMDWLGPIIYEYYAATEGGGTFITPRRWLEKPGTVGPPNPGSVIDVRDDDGRTLPVGEVGTIYFKAPDIGRFEYYKDAKKTGSAYRGDFFTLGDMGYFDEDGYLFLSGRSAEVIISGGVNVYPAEIDAVLLRHPAVADVATVGVPDEEWGEQVKAVVHPRPDVVPTEQLAQELIDLCREHLAHYKCPRTVDFVDELPRHDTGKIYRRKVRQRYWEGREKSI
jgi:long-chain acyl-CoA synthetase